MTTVDELSEYIGYEVVAQRKKSKSSSSSYCPGVITGVSKNDKKLTIKFGDNEKSDISISNMFINDPDDIRSSNKYYLNLASIYSANTSVLADIQYNYDYTDFQYGKISSYNSSAGTCNVIFNKFGIIKNIPLASIITPCDNRYITGVIESKNNFIAEKPKSVLPERECQPIESIDNIKMDLELESGEELENKYKKILPYSKYLLCLNLFVLLFTILIISLNFSYFYHANFKISRFSFINYIWIIIWIPLISFSLGPFYLIYWSLVQILEIFNFKVSFCLSCYLGGASLFNYPVFIFVLVLITLGYLYLIRKNLYNLRLNTKINKKTIPSVNLNTNSVDDKIPKVSSPNLNSLGKTIPNSAQLGDNKIPSL